MNRVKDYQQTARIRQQQPPRAPWELDSNHRAGFAQSVHNNQTQMALYYARELFSELDETIADLRAEIEELKKPKAEKPTDPTPKPRKAPEPKKVEPVEVEESSATDE